MDASVKAVLCGLCQASYYINLLGIKLPLCLTVRASRARLALGLVLFLYVPLLACSHVLLLPMLRESAWGLYVWHGLVAVWVTIPLIVVGTIIICFVRSAVPLAMLSASALGTLALHWYVLPAVQPTWFGGVLLQVLFAFFEDGSTAGWVWCLYHAVRLQNYARSQDRRKPKARPGDSILIMGNAPTVTAGSPLGTVIDGFTDVVRFNGYSTEKQEHTGSKVTYHYCNGRNAPNSCAIKAVLPLFNASLTHACYLFMPHMMEATETCERLMSTKVDTWFIEEERILALCKKINCHFWQIPSSGMAAIDEFLSRYPEVTLHGFTFFEGKQIHYFRETPLQLITSWLERFVTHNPAREKQWVQGLLGAGCVSFLAQAPAALAVDAGTPALQRGPADHPCAGEKAPCGGVRKRLQGFSRFLAMDGLPSQFSL
mmetsp:Transcript_67962/g.191558  ORF Transcript_67962/g.191558 Transcript_67962/m.191558 type:complete len:429 (-) Transcript_67962:292-1578(-)